MTNAEMNYIIRHRKAGKGCAEIARTLGISANTVKSFCRRNSIVPDDQASPADSAETKCLQCGKAVIRSPHRKVKRFCSDACRLAWWHSHRDLARNALERRCRYCGMVFHAIFAVCREVLDEVLDTSELDRIATRLQDQALGMAERVRKLVEENARVRRDQEEYQQEYDALAAEHEKLSEKIQSVEDQKKDKADRRRRIEVFLCMLEERKECVRFDPYTFVALVDKIVVGQDRKLEINFRNGMKYEYTIVG